MPAPVVGMKAAFREAVRTKAGLAGFGMLGFLLGLVVVVPMLAPYDVVQAWGDVSAWTDNPRYAAPEWIDAFSDTKRARTVLVDWDDFSKGESNTSTDFKIIILRARWQFSYDLFPSELRLQINLNWTRTPIITIEWMRPDGEVIALYERYNPERPDLVLQFLTTQFADPQQEIRNWAVDELGAESVETKDVRPHIVLYAKNETKMLYPKHAHVLKGVYSVMITAIVGVNDTMEARMTTYGTVHGVAGTDHMRRDLFIGLIWGAPVALMFGAAAAILTVMTQVILGALGAYYGGRFDEIVQRATDFVIILPVLPILVLIGAMYTPGILIILFVVVLFNIVGGTTKVIRSIALQVKEEVYVEAARSYGASKRRVLFRYILPRTLPYTFALLALSVPSFIFLEASLSFLGLGDPVLPTWGAIMGDASRNGAMYNGLWWWIAFPALGIVFTTIAFAFLGYAFDKVLNPRLREE